MFEVPPLSALGYQPGVFCKWYRTTMIICTAKVRIFLIKHNYYAEIFFGNKKAPVETGAAYQNLCITMSVEET